MKKIFNYIKLMLQDRGGCPNTKLHFGSLFAIVMIVGLFLSVDTALYQTFTFATLALFGISAVDNLTAPKITIDKTETNTTTKDIEIKANAEEVVDKFTKIVKKKK